MPKAKPRPDIPSEISPELIDSWRETLDIDKTEVAAMLGKSATFWSKFLAGEQDLKLKQLNFLLKIFAIRAEALMKNRPPLRTGSFFIGLRRYPAIIGQVQGKTREMFVCGLHVDRFIGTLPLAELWELLQQGMELRADGDAL